MKKYRKVRKDGKPYAKTKSGYRLLRLEDGTPYYIWVGKIGRGSGPTGPAKKTLKFLNRTPISIAEAPR